MDKEELLNDNKLEGLTAAEIWERSYGKELNTKKNILEYINMAMTLRKENLNEEQLQATYIYIYDHIEGMKDTIKPNTMMYLKNSLKAELGKYVKEKDPKPLNHFIEFFKEAYPENTRRKDFTWVLMDIKNISEEQIWTTLAHINRKLLSENIDLSSEQKKDIVEMVDKLLSRNNIKYINNLKSLKKLTEALGIDIVSSGKVFKVKRNVSHR